MRTLSFFLSITVFLLSRFCWSQPECADDFNDISSNCIERIEKKFTDTPIPISKLTKDTIFFYKNPSGEFGKLKILSITNKPQQECTVFINGFTYTSDTRGFVTNTSLSISPEKNHWLADRIFLDKDGTSSLILEKVSQEELDKKGLMNGGESSQRNYTSDEEIARSKASCLLIPSKGTEYTIYRKGTGSDRK